jgi:hypothetical protein
MPPLAGEVLGLPTKENSFALAGTHKIISRKCEVRRSHDGERWVQILLFALIVFALVKPLGIYMFRVFESEKQLAAFLRAD